MKTFKTKIEGRTGEFNFECYENTEPIEIGDVFIFFFAGIADVQRCNSEKEKEEINPNDRVRDDRVRDDRVRDNKTIDLVTGFWEKCYKIKTTDFDLNSLD